MKIIVLQNIKTHLQRVIEFFKVSLLLIIILVSTNVSYSQQVLNGSFENNSADTCLISPYSHVFHTLMDDVIVIDTFGSFLDIVRNDCAWGWGDAQNGNYTIGIGSNLINGDTVREKIALKLSIDLEEGNEYSFSYYFKGWDFSSLEIGASETSNDFGILIQSSPPAYPNIGVWIKQDVNFVAPNNSSFITVRMPDTGMALDWLLIDNFKFPSTSNINEQKKDIPTPRIYPNPIVNKGDLSIEVKGLMEIEILDTFGKKILSKKMDHHSLLNKINLLDLNHGIYFLKMRLYNGQIITKKIVKK